MKKLTYKSRLETSFLTGLIIGILILPSLVEADLSAEASAKGDDFTLSGYIEVGRKSTAEDYEEEDTDDDYTFQNYHLKLEQRVSDRLSYDISSFVYDKDYKAADSLDNISRIFKTNWSYYLKKLKEESLELDFSVKYKEKRYKNSPGNEYNEIRAVPSLIFKKKDLYTIDLALGIDNFDYLAEGQKNQFKIFTKIGGERYFLDKKLLLTSSYKIEQLEQEKADRKRTKHEVLGGFDYLFDIPWIYKIVTRVSWGQRDTKEEEERDEDYDYEYWRYFAKTEHRINPKLKTNLKYQYFKKDYLTADLDHRGFYIQNSWDYEVLDDEKQRIGFDLGLEHKDVKYNLKSGNDYQKETAEVKLSYKRKKNWQTSIGLEENFYDFSSPSGIPQNAGDDSTNDKKRSYAKISVEKLFLEGDLVLSLDLKYIYTDYEQKDDKEQEAVRIAFKYRF
ncbi:MAG: hypothetical protein AABZ36_05815 [Nitrospirota bacterium]